MFVLAAVEGIEPTNNPAFGPPRAASPAAAWTPADDVPALPGTSKPSRDRLAGPSVTFSAHHDALP